MVGGGNIWRGVKDAVIFHGAGVSLGVGAVDAVDVLGQQDHVRDDLGGPEHGSGVRGEVGVAGVRRNPDQDQGRS